jgi:hypothetical protein
MDRVPSDKEKNLQVPIWKSFETILAKEKPGIELELASLIFNYQFKTYFFSPTRLSDFNFMSVQKMLMQLWQLGKLQSMRILSSRKVLSLFFQNNKLAEDVFTAKFEFLYRLELVYCLPCPANKRKRIC